MTKQTFERLYTKIKNEYDNIRYLKTKLYVFIFYISHISTYRELRDRFGGSHATIFRDISEISEALSSIAKNEIKFPTQDEYEQLKEGFLRFGTTKGCILTIDGTHLAITRPDCEEPFDYYNRKGFFSLSFICVFDDRLRFRGVTYGYGKNHDSRILRESRLINKIEAIDEENTYVLGDSAFGNFRNIRITSWTTRNDFENTVLHSYKTQRVTSEHAFGRFKGKFRYFQSRIVNGEREKSIKIIKSAMWLHNFIIDEEPSN